MAEQPTSKKPTILTKAFAGRYAVSIDEDKKVWFHTARSSDGCESRHTATMADLIDIAKMCTEAAAEVWVRESGSGGLTNNTSMSQLRKLLSANESLEAVHKEMKE